MDKVVDHSFAFKSARAAKTWAKKVDGKTRLEETGMVIEAPAGARLVAKARKSDSKVYADHTYSWQVDVWCRRDPTAK